jgi:signal transduction histidine kinase
MENVDSPVPSILIVDDNPKNLQVLGKLLQEEKYDVEFAVDGESALGWINNKEFDLILLDINMPGMNGFEVCRIVRTDPIMNKVSIIFLSAESERESILKGFEVGGQDYITKPFDNRELIVRAKTHITLKRSLEKLEKVNAYLEKKVKERTSELEKTNVELNIAKNKAEESDRLKSAFLATMSHEIRTPMNGILGFAELLREPDLTGDEQEKYVKLIEKSGNRMLNIINDIVDLSKIEAGMVPLNIRESKINESCEYLCAFFKPDMEKKGLQLHYATLVSPNDSVIKTDPEKVGSILSILLKNAIKYTDKGSVEFGYRIKGDYMEFFVKDTGIGIPKSRQEAVFERFIQADISNVKAYQGAGLGLTIAKGYVELLGGKISVESEERKGTTFYFTIPILPR